MRSLYIYFLLVCVPFAGLAQKELHSWYEKHHMGIRFNTEQSQVLIVAHDRVTLWNTADGSLLQSMPMPKYESKAIVPADFEFIDAAPDLSEFIYKVDGTYQRFMLDIEDLDLFPDFQGRRIKQILGYDSNGWMVFFSEGFYQGFYRVQQTGNLSTIEFLSLEFINKAAMSNDHKYILFTRDGTFRYMEITTKTVADTKLPSAYWRSQHLPPGMVTLYQWDNSKKEGSKVVSRYFITLGESPGKKLTGKAAQSNFPQKDFCADYPSFVYGNANNTHWVVKYQDSDKSGTTKYKYALLLENSADCSVLKTIPFSESRTEHEAKKGQKQQIAQQQRQEEKAKAEVMKPAWFQEYITKFPMLPSSYTFDYERAVGAEVTNLTFVQNEKYRLGNPGEFAIGRLMNCPSGNVVVLRMTRNIKGGMDRQSFFVITYDSNGNEVASKKIGETQKLNGQFPVISFFTIETNNNRWVASVQTKSTTTGKPTSSTHEGTCM